MPNPALLLCSFLASAFTLAIWLQPWHAAWEGDRRRDQGVLAAFLGDGRRIFGEYFFRKADIYFHSGVYPSMFDQAAAAEENHMASTASAPTESHPAEAGADAAADPDHDHDHAQDPAAGHDHDHESPALGPRKDAPIDWLDRFSRQFYPTKHVHLQEGTDAREILPWIRISAELDPQRVATYTTAAYWLRRHLGKTDEAERFLREGLRNNPGNPEILLELGRLYDEELKQPDRARTLYELALRQWQTRVTPDEEDITVFRQIVVHLAWLEERQGNLPKAVQYWQALQARLDDPSAVRARIAELEARLTPPHPETAAP
jgi:tetratricopeptide (TPR) repeat protein